MRCNPRVRHRILVFTLRLFLFILLISVATSQVTFGQDEVSVAFKKYWSAPDESLQEKATEEILSLNLPFDEVYKKVREGRIYSENVKRGFISWERRAPNGVQLFTLIFVPYDYSPDKKYPVRVFLHGDISHIDPYNVLRFIDTTLQDYKSMQQIRIYPSGYFAARWYYDIQYRNVMDLIDSVKKIYNVDENSVSLGGLSDGGTGTFAFANYNPTPFSCFTPYIGSSAGLKFLGEHQAYFLNFTNKPFFIVNGFQDKTFPPEVVQPYADQIIRLYHDVSYFMLDTFGHTMRWLPLLKDSIDHFISLHPRNPYPGYLVWQTEDLRYNRNHWVVINSLGETRYHSLELQDENLVMINGTLQEAFTRDTAYGIIEVKRTENIVRVRTNGVKSYTLLFSPDVFDFSKPVTVYTNDLVSFEGMLEKSEATLLKWNSTDDDRTMLFAAELKINVDKARKK